MILPGLKIQFCSINHKNYTEELQVKRGIYKIPSLSEIKIIVTATDGEIFPYVSIEDIKVVKLNGTVITFPIDVKSNYLETYSILGTYHYISECEKTMLIRDKTTIIGLKGENVFDLVTTVRKSDRFDMENSTSYTTSSSFMCDSSEVQRQFYNANAIQDMYDYDIHMRHIEILTEDCKLSKIKLEGLSKGLPVKQYDNRVAIIKYEIRLISLALAKERNIVYEIKKAQNILLGYL
jgi:hypothetical protein